MQTPSTQGKVGKPEKRSLGKEEIVLHSEQKGASCDTRAISPRSSSVLWTDTHTLVSAGDLWHLHEDLPRPEMFSSPIAVAARGVVNSLCNTLLEADAGALNRVVY